MCPSQVPVILAPYVSLWNTCQEFGKNSYQWLNGPMSLIDPEPLEKEVRAAHARRPHPHDPR